MLEQFRPACLVLLLMTVLTGGVYPLVVTGIAQLAFPFQASGSLVRRDDKLVGSDLIGQPFSKPEYFWGRLSATPPGPYNAVSSSGSNLGPMNPALVKLVEERIAALRRYPVLDGKIPVDLVTASASGLDPHVSPAAAEFQIPRVARVRNLSEDDLREVVRRHIEPRQLAMLGEPRVNVLRLNRALDEFSTGR